MSSRALPLVYACSGCLSMAQVASRLAVDLDCINRAKMSYISGVGGNAHTPVKTARNGRSILALNGCVLTYVRVCLVTVDVAPDVRLVLNQCGAKRHYHADRSDGELNAVAALMDDAVNILRHRSDTAGD